MRQRFVKTPVYGFGEGPTEEALLLYMRRRYATSVALTVGNAGGKHPDYILEKAMRTRSPASAHSFILYDDDRPWPDELVARARTAGFELFPSRPSIEALLLQVLGIPVNPNDSAAELKRVLRERLRHRGVITQRDLALHYPYDILEEARARIRDLHRIARILEGQLEPEDMA